MSLSKRRPIRFYGAGAFITICLMFFLLQHQSNRHSINSCFGLPRQIPISSIPEKIWYKLGPKDLSDEMRGWIDTCLKQNPTYEHEFLTDSSADAWVREKFAYRPHIIEPYFALPIPILKADILRYLLLFAEGGIWSDLDVSCGETPIRDWIPAEHKRNASLVIEWEFQIVDAQHMREFVTWMIMAKPGSRHMSMVINDTLKAVRNKARENNVAVTDLKMNMVGDVVWLTGPMAMSKSIIKSLGVEHEKLNIGATPYVFEPMPIQDVLILPGYSFSASLQNYKPEEVPGPALVTHHFAGSWKNDDGGEVVDPVT